MSKILRKCLSLALVVMLLASLSLNGSLSASADNKTGDGLAAYAMRAYNEGWVYSWGGATPGAVDCSGLIYSYVGGGARTTEDMLNSSYETGYVSNGVPDIPGLGLWQPGHVGVYVGGGMAVDARDEISNVCYQSVATKSWVMWFKVNGVSYETDASVTNNNPLNENTDSSDSKTDNMTDEPEYLSKGSSGSEVQDLQERLKELGYFEENTTQYFGSVTENALIEFQTAAGLTPTGVYDEATEISLMSIDAPKKIAEAEEYFDSESVTDNDSQNDASLDNSNENVNIPDANPEEISSDIDVENVNNIYNEDSQEGNIDINSDSSQKEIEVDETALAEDDVSEETDTNEYAENGTDTPTDIVYTIGDFGNDISNIQYMLIKLDYYHYDITSEFDEKTFNAIEFFQLDNGLTATGYINEETLSAIYNKYNSEISLPDEDINVTQEEIFDADSNSGSEFVSDTTAENILNNSSEAESDYIISKTAETASTDTQDTDSSADDTTTIKSSAVKSDNTTSVTSTKTDTSNLPKSPKTGDPIVLSIQSAIEYVKNYVNTTLVLIIVGITCILVFFVGTVHYWNVSMEKRRRRARKATTVSVYRRRSM